MDATKVDPQPVHRNRKLLLGATVAILVLLGIAIAVLQSRRDAPASDRTPAVAEATPEATPDAPSAEQVATGFLEAFGALDVERMQTYLANDAVIASMGADDDPRLLAAWLGATGYEQILGSCEQLDGSSGTVRCPFDFHGLRSAEIGRGPFGGSSFDVTVVDGKVVRVEQDYNVEDFSPRMWEPFQAWVSKSHPKDAALMYTGGGSGVALTEESIRLWERNTQGYVHEVKQHRRDVRKASSVSSG